LTEAVQDAFPEFPPHRGEYDEVVPHLTIGQNHSLRALQEAEYAAQLNLPVEQEVDHVELWTGPILGGPVIGGSWRCDQAFPLG